MSVKVLCNKHSRYNFKYNLWNVTPRINEGPLYLRFTSCIIPILCVFVHVGIERVLKCISLVCVAGRPRPSVAALPVAALTHTVVSDLRNTLPGHAGHPSRQRETHHRNQPGGRWWIHPTLVSSRTFSVRPERKTLYLVILNVKSCYAWDIQPVPSSSPVLSLLKLHQFDFQKDDLFFFCPQQTHYCERWACHVISRNNKKKTWTNINFLKNSSVIPLLHILFFLFLHVGVVSQVSASCLFFYFLF